MVLQMLMLMAVICDDTQTQALSPFTDFFLVLSPSFALSVKTLHHQSAHLLALSSSLLLVSG
jgi:hypothetical protein